MGWLTTPTPFPPAVPLEWLWGGSGTGNRAQGLHTHLLAGLAELGAPPWLALSTCRSGNTAISSTGVCGCVSEVGRWTLVTPTRRGSACQCPIPQGGSAGWAVTVHKAARDLKSPPRRLVCPQHPQPGPSQDGQRSGLGAAANLESPRMEGGQGFLPPCRPLGRSAEKQQPLFAGQDTLSLRRG